MDNKEAYDEGYKDGMRAYAHWREGKMYVGTTGTSLSEALKSRRENWNYFPRKVE